MEFQSVCLDVKKWDGGFSLIEVMVALSLLALGLVGTMSAQEYRGKTDRLSLNKQTADNLAATVRTILSREELCEANLKGQAVVPSASPTGIYDIAFQQVYDFSTSASIPNSAAIFPPLYADGDMATCKSGTPASGVVGTLKCAPFITALPAVKTGASGLPILDPTLMRLTGSGKTVMDIMKVVLDKRLSTGTAGVPSEFLGSVIIRIFNVDAPAPGEISRVPASTGQAWIDRSVPISVSIDESGASPAVSRCIAAAATPAPAASPTPTLPSTGWGANQIFDFGIVDAGATPTLTTNIIPVSFTKNFKSPPRVITFLPNVYWKNSCSSTGQLSFGSDAESITLTGFNIALRGSNTGCGGRGYGYGQVGWIAVGEPAVSTSVNTDYIQFGEVAVADLASTSGSVTFGSTYANPPTVILHLGDIHMKANGCNGNDFGATATAGAVSGNGFAFNTTAVKGGCGNTILRKIQWVAIGKSSDPLKTGQSVKIGQYSNSQAGPTNAVVFFDYIASAPPQALSFPGKWQMNCGNSDRYTTLGSVGAAGLSLFMSATPNCAFHQTAQWLATVGP